MPEVEKVVQTILQDPTVLVYLLTIVAGQLLYALLTHWRRNYIARKRRQRGLSKDRLAMRVEQLQDRKIDVVLQSFLLILTVIFTPFLLVQTNLSRLWGVDAHYGNLAVVFGAIVIWFLLTGTDVLKAFLGGLAFKTLVAFKQPFFIGDRVSISGFEGKVIDLDIFFVTMKTLNDDLVSIPTNTLWTEVLSSANAGDRASLCVMKFYLAPFVSAEQRQQAEDAIWDAIQSSTYFDPTKPMQIYLSQNSDTIQLTAKAYVASTYKESQFASDVHRAFLDFVSERGIPIAAGGWELSPELESK